MPEALRPANKLYRRCDVCLFVLDKQVSQIDEDDVDFDWEQYFGFQKTLEFTPKRLSASAERGCHPCGGLVSAFGRLGIEFTKAEWWWDANEPSFQPFLDVFIKDKVDDVKRFELFSWSEEVLRKRVPLLHPVVDKRRELLGSSGSDESIGRAHEWLDDCRRNHGKCRASDEGFVPTRLLFLNGRDPNKVELIEHPARGIVYAALSHRWVKETETVSLLKSNLQRRKQEGIAMSDLPLMMQNVISVLRRLEIHYVWIDCLCILQDKDDKEDWIREAPTMASIYTNAELTIAASWCVRDGQALFCERDGPKQSSHEIARIDGQPIFLRRQLPHFRWPNLLGFSPKIEWPLLIRGWVYQEQLLSRRVLHFTGDEVFWECYERSVCECEWSDRGGDRNPGIMGRNKEPVADRPWNLVIAEFAARPLSFEADRLPAIAGIAKSMARSKGKDLAGYVCGMWMEDRELRETFFWYLMGRPPRHGRPKTKNRIPTWSWASTFDDKRFLRKLHEDIAFLHTKVRFVKGVDSTMGFVESASITLSARTLPGIVRYGPDLATVANSLSAKTGLDPTIWQKWRSKSSDFVLQVQDRLAFFRADYKLDIPGDDFIESGTPVLCLWVGVERTKVADPNFESPTSTRPIDKDIPTFLVLRCVDEEERVYERLGCLYGRHGQGLEAEAVMNKFAKRQLTVI